MRADQHIHSLPAHLALLRATRNLVAVGDARLSPAHARLRDVTVRDLLPSVPARARRGDGDGLGSAA
jgi:hypothetical protein